MSQFIPGGYKIVIFHDHILPQLTSNDLIEQCCDMNEFHLILSNNRSLIRVLACTYEIFLALSKDLMPPKLDKIYFINTSSSNVLSSMINEDESLPKIIISSERELIVRVLLDISICFYNQLKKYQEKGDQSSANICGQIVLDALDLLKQHNEYLCPL
ncbi:hypothetical protein I4U23_010634 [Adineta vaga]|nr:hypothetical protein I4U23_010634 [Adineta vaga]